MAELQLSQEEREVLAKTLEWVLTETGMEIADTDLMTFRECLKDQRELLRNVLDRLGPREPVTQSGK